MLTWISHWLGDIPIPGVVALLVLGTVQVGLQLFAAVDLVRRREVAGGRKSVWALAIGLGGLVGAGVYLGVGRTPSKPLSVTDDLSDPSDRARRRAIDSLYGPHDRS